MKEVDIAGRVRTKDDFQDVLPGWEEEVSRLLTARKERILERYFTNPRGEVTAIRGTMPPVLAAALTARFSRAHKFDITELFWQEFVENPEVGNLLLAKEQEKDSGLESLLAEDKARGMIRRIIDAFGDDSVREQASAYVMVRGHSVLFSLEAFQHPLITGIEASTRYINWGEKVDGEFLYTRPPEIMNSPYRDTYVEAMDYMFATYQRLWPVIEEYVISTNPKPEDMKEASYKQAVRGRVCDNLRKLLPLGIKSNSGIHADYRSLSELIMNLRASELPETRRIADEMAKELTKINPEFIAVVDSTHGETWTNHRRKTLGTTRAFSGMGSGVRYPEADPSVSLTMMTPDYLVEIARGALSTLNPGLKGDALDEAAIKTLNRGDILVLLQRLGELRENRRHKLPTYFNNVLIRVDFGGISFGAYKDINRHRDIDDKTQPDYSGALGVYVPEDIEAIGGAVKEEYLNAQQVALFAHDIIERDLPIEVRRLLTHGMRTDVSITMSLGEAYWIAELRSIASGDPEYRRFAQMLYEAMLREMPELRRLRTFVDRKDYKVGRIQEAVRADLKGIKKS